MKRVFTSGLIALLMGLTCSGPSSAGNPDERDIRLYAAQVHAALASNARFPAAARAGGKVRYKIVLAPDGSVLDLWIWGSGMKWALNKGVLDIVRGTKFPRSPASIQRPATFQGAFRFDGK